MSIAPSARAPGKKKADACGAVSHPLPPPLPPPSFLHVFVTNVILVSACVAMAIFYPKIGTILRYCGAICGLIYVFALPVLVDRACLIREGKYGWPQAIKVGVVIVLGLVNLVGQFVVN